MAGSPRSPGKPLGSVVVALALAVSVLAAEEPPAPPPGGAPAPATGAAQLVRRAVELIGQEDLEGAIAVLEPLRDDPRADPAALATLGALYAEIGLPEDALAVLQPLAAGDGADPAVLYNAGRAAIQLGRLDEGEGYLARSVELVPVSPAARFLGLYLGGRGRILDAYRLLAGWVEASPDDQEARRAAAVCALRLRRVPEAEALLGGLPADDPTAGLLRAELLLQKREPAAAAELLESLSARLPPALEIDGLQLLATAYLESGRSRDAVELLAGKHLAHPKLTLTLARAHYQGGEAEQALAALAPLAEQLGGPESARAGAVVGPLAAAIALEHGRLLVAVERPAEALATLDRAAELDPWSAEVWQLKAQALAASGRRQEADEALARFRELSEARQRAATPGMKGRRMLDDTTGRRLVEAAEWLERGEPDEALTIARQEISLAPEDLRPRLFEARVLLAAERLDEALASFEAAAGLAPDAPELLALGAQIRAARGERAEARRLLERLLELRPEDGEARRRLEALTGPGAG